MGTVTAILILAVVVEALVEYFVAPAVKPEREGEPPSVPEGAVDWRGLTLRYSAAVIGVALCLVYSCDILAMAGLTTGVPAVGPVVTGLLLGRGANFINDFADTWLSPAKKLLGR